MNYGIVAADSDGGLWGSDRIGGWVRYRRAEAQELDRGTGDGGEESRRRRACGAR